MTARLDRFTVSVDVEVRLAVEGDLPALEWMGLYAAHRDILRMGFEAQQRGDASLILGISGGFPIAQVFIDYARPELAGRAMIWGVRTFYPLQGRGIGGRMMQAAEAHARDRGFSSARLTVERENTGAHRFYRRLGWQLIGPGTERFTVRGNDASEIPVTLDVLVMEKQLRLAPQTSSGRLTQTTP